MISDAVLGHLIDSVPPTIVAGAALYFGIVNKRGIQETKTGTLEVKDKLVEVGKNVDGKMEKMLQLQGEKSFAAGVKQEKAHPTAPKKTYSRRK
jgi:hypothetical protein